ncbi:MAG TPA: DUF485 domain-containing protein [Thermoanaerobaculia bacterium]|nr:DUF485 domain-containing protein [Thermoanaerobaculia bacterium]
MKTTHEMLESEQFRRIVRRKWTVSVILTLCLFALYYGYILLIALDKEFLARKIGEATTLGIPLGVAVIVLSWVLTAVYVVWANNSYDAEVEKLREQVEK